MSTDPALKQQTGQRPALRIPAHIGVIMDGNGRWAKARGKPRTEGHIAGVKALRGIVEHYPGLQTEVVTFLGDRISESLSGETAQVAIKVFGDDLDALDATGDRIVSVLGKIPGIIDLQFKRQSGTPAIAIQLRPEALLASGLKAQDVLETIETAYTGARVGQTFSGTRTVDAVVLLPAALRHEPGQLAQLMISGPLGPVPLSHSVYSPR